MDSTDEETMDFDDDSDLALLLSPETEAGGCRLLPPMAFDAVDIFDGPVSRDEFERFYRHKRPVLLRGAAQSWPALSLWRDGATLGSALGATEDADLVTSLHSNDGRRFLGIDCTKSRKLLDAVVRELGEPSASRFYARAPLRGSLRSAVDLSALRALMGGASPTAANCSVWLGPAGNITPFHYDLCHGFLVGVIGRKTFTLVSPDEWRCMHSGHRERPELSRVDYEAWRAGDADERRRHPRFDQATRLVVEVCEGDVLYTPPFWWHHVETSAEGPAVSALIPFDPEAHEPTHVCHLR